MPKLFFPLLILGALTIGGNAAVAQQLPELPDLGDIACGPSDGTRIEVPSGGDLQAALNRAQPGDVITLAAGARYVGNFTLPQKSGERCITVRVGDTSGLPSAGERIGPEHAPSLPKLVTPNNLPAVTAAPGSSHYKLTLVEMRPTAGTATNGLVSLGGNGSDPNAVPHHLIFDRVYIHGDQAAGSKRGIALNSAFTTVRDSYIANIKRVGQDSQALIGWNGPGPFLIENNYLEGAGENVMFGGADPSIDQLVPANIVIRGNHFFKPRSWKVGDPSFAGTEWSVKNLLELKNARRVLIEDNLFEHNWPNAQNGMSILFTPRNQQGTAAWSQVRDVTFRYNEVREISGGINILGTDPLYPSADTKRILVEDNLFENVGGAPWYGTGRWFQILRGPDDVIVRHNTVFQAGPIIMAEGPQLANNFVFKDNICPHNTYGVLGTGTAPGANTLETYFSNYDFAGNVIVGGGSPDSYPAGNFFPDDFQAVAFADRSGRDYVLVADSPYKGAATDGDDPGVRWDAFDAMAPPSGDDPTCGDGICDVAGGENCDTCSADCAPASDQVCCDGLVYPGECCGDSECGSGQVCVAKVCEPGANDDSSSGTDDSGSGSDTDNSGSGTDDSGSSTSGSDGSGTGTDNSGSDTDNSEPATENGGTCACSDTDAPAADASDSTLTGGCTSSGNALGWAGLLLLLPGAARCRRRQAARQA